MLRFSAFCFYGLCIATFAVPTPAESGNSTVVFDDQFARELKADAQGIENDWKLNSHEEHRFVLQDGVARVTRNSDAKHYANLLHKADFRNGSLTVRFKLADQSAPFRIQVRDSALKTIKQGMLFNVRAGNGQLELQDAAIAYQIKLSMKAAKVAKPSSQQQATLDAATTRAPLDLSLNEWHELLVHVQGNELTVSIDGTELASLASESIAHPTKDNFRIEVGRALEIDRVTVISCE